jgi:glycosyltransferase involved in cell wall biosynthesis
MNFPLVSILIPTFNSSKFIANCINSVLAQTYTNYKIIISDDASSDNTPTICKSYIDIDENNENNKKMSIHYQNTNIGWVKNINYLISISDGDYYIILPSDDTIPENYISMLMKYMLKHPNAVNCYPIIRCVGEKNHKIKQMSITGNLEDRVNIFLLNIKRPTVSFRGLINKKMIINHNPELLYLFENLYRNIRADTLQILQHLLVGELHCVPVLYFKTYHQNNEHIKNWNLTDTEYIIWKKTYFNAIHNIISPHITIHKINNILNHQLTYS